MRYAIVIEQGEGNYSAYVPDLPGCVAVGQTLEETRRQMREAIEFHLEGLRADGVSVPEPTSLTLLVLGALCLIGSSLVGFSAKGRGRRKANGTEITNYGSN